MFFGRSRGRFNLIDASTCRTSAVVLTKKIASQFASIYQPRNARMFSAAPHVCFSFKKSACSPSAVNDFNKTYSTSAVPLLVRNVSYVCGAVARNS